MIGLSMRLLAGKAAVETRLQMAERRTRSGEIGLGKARILEACVAKARIAEILLAIRRLGEFGLGIARVLPGRLGEARIAEVRVGIGLRLIGLALEALAVIARAGIGLGARMLRIGKARRARGLVGAVGLRLEVGRLIARRGRGLKAVIARRRRGGRLRSGLNGLVGEWILEGLGGWLAGDRRA